MKGNSRAPDNRFVGALQQTHLSLNGYVRKQEVFLSLGEKGKVTMQ